MRVYKDGVPIDIPVSFHDITVADEQNHVCSGMVHAQVIANLGAPIVITPTAELEYQVAEIIARPYYASVNNGYGKIRVVMPNTIRTIDEYGEELDTLNIAGPELDP